MELCASTCFQYRLPRSPRRFPIRFFGKETPVDGYCLNLSETGLLAQLEYPISTAGPCMVRMVLPVWTVDLPVDLAYTDRCLAGFRFLFDSEQQQQFVRALMSGCQTPFRRA